MPQTKEELLHEIDELKSQIRELTEQLAERSAVARGSSEAGYLFTTRNPAYSGTVYGVRFESGRGFLPKSRKDAERTARKIVSDFGYEMSEITSDQFEAMPATPAAGNERAFVEKISTQRMVAAQ